MDIRKVSFIKTMRVILLIVLTISVIWNTFCFLGVLPLKLYTVTYLFVCIPFAIISFRSFLFQTRNVSNYIGDLNPSEKIQSSVIACLTVLWIATAIVCLVR